MLSENEIETKVNFLSSARCNHTFHKYIDITGDLIEGTLLSRILYWFAPSKDNKSKVKIYKDGEYWIAKQRKDWWEEIRITERQYDKAIKSLVKKEFVITAKYKFNSMPTIHIRPNYDVINAEVKKWEDNVRQEVIAEDKGQELHKQADGNNTKCNSQGNDTKCNSGMTQGATLLTGITSNDYFNTNYRTLNTECNSLNREQCNSFLPEDKKAKKFKPVSEYSQSDWEVAEEGMISRASKIAYDWTNDETLKENVKSFFEYFLGKHREYTGEYHYPLTDKVLSRVVDSLTKETEIERDGYTDNYYSTISNMKDNVDYKMLVDEYFNTKFSTQCDYSLVHFSSEKVLTNTMNHVCKSSWCESKEW